MTFEIHLKELIIILDNKELFLIECFKNRVNLVVISSHHVEIRTQIIK